MNNHSSSEELTTEQLSIDLREGSSGFLKNRRVIVGLSFFSAGVMGGIASIRWAF